VRSLLALLLAANAAVLGLILLLSGLRQLSPRTSMRVRHGIVVKWTAANLLLVVLAAAMLVDTGALDAAEIPWYLLLAFIPLFVGAARSGILLFRSGWKYDAFTAADARARDPRPPVLYFRSFHDDSQIVVAPRRGVVRARFLWYTAGVSPEQEIAFILGQVGPVIAIGKPGERLPELGAARIYVSDDQWRCVVTAWMSEAALVVFRAGETEGLWWEIEQALAQYSRRRIVIVELGPSEAHLSFRRRFEATFGVAIQHAAPRVPWASALLTRMFVWTPVSLGRLIYFDAGGAPQEQPLLFHYTWQGFIMSAYRPYRDPLRATFRAVFAQLGIRWGSPKSQLIAIVLALFGGMLWLHEFYLGSRRRAVRHLASFWLMVPVVHILLRWGDAAYLGIVLPVVPIGLGWIAASRLALLDEAQFRARAGPSAAAR
jgi:TM2 domain-containing membrane protein YozV